MRKVNAYKCESPNEQCVFRERAVGIFHMAMKDITFCTASPGTKDAKCGARREIEITIEVNDVERGASKHD